MTLTARDLEYRAALGLDADEPLPNAIGQTEGHSRNPATRWKHYYEPNPPAMASANGPTFPAVDLGKCDLTLRRKRRAIAMRGVPRGDVDSQLDEYAEAIAYAEAARDLALKRSDRLAAAAYVVRLKDRRDALMRSAGQPVSS